jgi:hypothetical protein
MRFDDGQEEFTQSEIEEFARQFRLHATEESSRASLDEIVDQVALDSWDRGFNAALELLHKRGATVVANELAELRDAYWRTQGVD